MQATMMVQPIPESRQQHDAPQAVGAWPKLVDKAAALPGCRLGSPATSGRATMHGAWFETFMDKVNGPILGFSMF